MVTRMHSEVLPAHAQYVRVPHADVDCFIWGCGGVGLMAQKSAFLLGAERVIAIDRFPERLRAAREEVGAETINYEEVGSVLEALQDMTGGRGPDACVGAVGMEAHWTGLQYKYDRVKQALRMETDRGDALR